MTKPHEARQFYQDTVLAYDGDDCLTWPFRCAQNGYAKLVRDGRYQNVSRLVCGDTHGEPPTPKHEAAHSCGKGHLGCVAKRHLSWKTRTENQADRIAHGTDSRGEKHGMAKLRNDDIRAIRALKGSLNKSEIARRFGVDRSSVYSIFKGETWRHVA